MLTYKALNNLAPQYLCISKANFKLFNSNDVKKKERERD